MLLSKIIQSIAKVAHTNPTREVLQSLYITKDKVVCTDGFRLLEYKLGNTSSENFPKRENITPCELAEGESLLINAKELCKFKFKPSKILPVLSNALLCNKTENFVSLLSTDSQSDNMQNFKLVKGEYPKYESIIPTQNPVASVTCDAQLLIDVLQAFVDRTSKHNAVTISLYGENSAIKFTNPKQDVIGLLMPIKS